MRKKLLAIAMIATMLAVALTTGVSNSSAKTQQKASADTATIVYNSNASDPAPRKFDDEVVKMWNDAHPDMPVQHSIVNHEDFKQAIRAYLVAQPSPDVLTWFGGERTRFFIDKGLVADISDVWKSAGFDKSYAPAFTALGTVNDKQYFMANNYYWWALYFRPSILKANNVKAPQTWDDLLGACDTLSKAGITPITIGSNQPWTTAAWFDYLDMRINGPDFHIRLMALKEKYTDDKVKKVLTTMKQLFDHKCFNTDAASLKWQDAVTPLAQGKAAMYLMGAFITDTYNAIDPGTKGYDKADLDFTRFPIIDPAQKIGEDAPTDGLFLSANAANLAGAKKFLAFMGSKEVGQKAVDDLGRLPVRTDVDTSKFTDAQKKGIKLIQTADVVAQFYDRDTTPPMAEVGLNALGGFFADYGKTDIDAMLKTLQTKEDQLIADAANAQ